jgi:hypothetical protein
MIAHYLLLFVEGFVLGRLIVLAVNDTFPKN